MFWPNLTNNTTRNKTNKIINWMKWVQKLLARKGILSDIDSCAYGKNHLVSHAKPIGGGWMFYSKGCSGCPISYMGMQLFELGKELPKGAPNCAFLSGPLFSLTKISDNTIITLPALEEGRPKLPSIGTKLKLSNKLATYKLAAPPKPSNSFSDVANKIYAKWLTGEE